MLFARLAFAYVPAEESFTVDYGYGGFGAVVSAAGDLDGDGLGDLLVGSATATGGSRWVAAFLASGPRDEASYLFRAWEDDEWGGALASLGDVDADGLPDIALGDPPSRVEVRYGSDLSKYVELNGWADGFGSAVFVPGDLDGDGVRDLVVGHRYGFDWFSGVVGAPCQRAVDGGLLVSAGDIDGDGLADLATIDGEEIRLLYGGPCDGLVREDVVALEGTAATAGLGPDGALLALTYDDASSYRLWRIDGGSPDEVADLTGFASAWQAGAVLAPGDLDCDGTLEIAVSMVDTSGRGTVRVMGEDGVILYELADAEGVGWTLAAPGDVDGDGCADLLAGGLGGFARVIYARPAARAEPVDPVGDEPSGEAAAPPRGDPTGCGRGGAALILLVTASSRRAAARG
ncbi:MAG: hypothetical protein ACOZNI_14040 [Myxococcota bacterium]